MEIKGGFPEEVRFQAVVKGKTHSHLGNQNKTKCLKMVLALIDHLLNGK